MTEKFDENATAPVDGTQTDDWKTDDVKKMEDESEETINRCIRCGEPCYESELHNCRNDEGTPDYGERQRQTQTYEQQEAQDKAAYEKRNR
jgi:ribosomal protein L37E